VVGSFHNSLTLLSAEVFGRSFGGGVLELVPSEVSALLIPLARIGDQGLADLDALVRRSGPDDEELVDATDRLVVKAVDGLTDDLMTKIRDARMILLNRRLARN
jgi:adenine-specific DNA-methyltransferase